MDSKERHLHLAGVVKGIHAKLRTKLKSGENFEVIWEEHCQNRNLLTGYATAMHELATDVWAKNNIETRIDWCQKVCMEYFFKDGLLKVLEKEKRKKAFDNAADAIKDSLNEKVTLNKIKPTSEIKECTIKPILVPNDDTVASCSACSQNKTSKCDSLNKESKINSDCVDEEERLNGAGTLIAEDLLNAERNALYMKYGETQYNNISIPFDGKIRLLDVGSCYNPFENIKEFISIAVDISPAVKSVYHCDFLHLETTPPLQLATDTIDSIIKCLKDPVEKLPKESFHVVVFSLLLEYFPSPFQRWICCEKAQKLLMNNGLLLIITPDSHHQNKNAPMMKSWKKAIESMGFKRWKYVKQEHLHCMAFRKVIPSEPENFLMSYVTADMLYIPQDFSEELVEEKEDDYFAENFRSEEDDIFIQEGLNELPVIEET